MQSRIFRLEGDRGPKKKKKGREENQVSAPMSSADDEGKRVAEGRIERGTRERGFMCSLVNERQALKVTGCVYY